jgi:hypothetical protein
MRRVFLLSCALAACLAAPVRAAVHIDASVAPPPPAPLAFAAGGKSPDGHVLGANSRYLTLDGRPWFPVMGEFHYSRYPAGEWEQELLKMKAGGINVVATYVFWLHHEETEGKFDWSGQRDLRRFVQACAKHGLRAWVRVGPWCHGEARNGGFPDWLVQLGDVRSNNPAYLAHVKTFYGEIGRQLRGLFWKDGGPIVGVQIENEYHPARGGIEHMRTLLALARDADLVAPFYSATGWDNAAVPPTDFLPVFGGYTEQFWSDSLGELPPNQNFFFTAIRAEDNVMGDLTPKNPGYNSKYDGFPFLTAEMGGGMSIAYHRRPLMHADDSTASALVKLGAGITGLGYYMYHGGTNPDGRTSLQETQSVWNGWNDMEAKSYDFQAPLGEFGQVNDTFRTLKTLHLFLADFGADLAPMPAYFPAEMPKSRDDTTTPRVVARADGARGFIFFNNYQRNHPLAEQRDFQISLRLPKETLMVPRTPLTLPTGAYGLWPVNLDLGGVTLRYATVQPLCRLAGAGETTLVCCAWPGVRADFAFRVGRDDKIDAPRARVAREGDHVYVEAVEPGTEVALRVTRAGGARTQVVVLPRAQALDLSRASLNGRDRLVLSRAAAWFGGDRILLAARDPAALEVGIFPAPAGVSAAFRATQRDGIFQRYASTASVPANPPAVTITQVRPAAPSVPAKLNPNPRRRVAMSPDDADFERAAVWRLEFSPGAIAAAASLTLRIDYVGDVARIYAGDRFDNDNFYKGTTWELALRRYTPEELRRGLDLKILPLRADTPLFLERNARPKFAENGEALALTQAALVREFTTVLEVR